MLWLRLTATPQTAAHIHIRYIQSVWADWYVVHCHRVAALHSYTLSTWLRFWGSVSLVESKWCHYVIVEAESHLRTEQLRKLGRLKNYYLDQFKQIGVFIRRKRENAKQLFSWNHGEWALSFQVVVFPGKCSAHWCEAKHMHWWICIIFKNMPVLYVVLMIVCRPNPSASVRSWHASCAAWIAKN